MSRALLVSEPGDEAPLLDPREVDAATGEWGLLHLAILTTTYEPTPKTESGAGKFTC